VIRFLKYFTFLGKEEIERLEEEVKQAPEKREAQRTLAKEVTELVHGKEALESSIKITKALFDGNVRDLSVAEIEEAFKDVPSTTLPDKPIALVDLLVAAQAAPSKRQARQDIESGAVYLNGTRTTELDRQITADDRLGGRYIVLRRGKKNYYLIQFA
jgi:tyrosyl-tRNA synthetase